MAGPANWLAQAIYSVIPTEWLNNIARSEEAVVDTTYLDEYLGGKRLEDQTLRPQSLTKFQDRPWKRLLPSDREHYNKVTRYGSDAPLSKTPQRMYPIEGSSGDLGRSTISGALDEQNKPYASIFDSWDFDEPGSSGSKPGPIESLKRAILGKMGKPYNIYERIPLEDITKYDRKTQYKNTYRGKATTNELINK